MLYFYPRDDTPGCTTEACGFSDATPDFSKAKAAIVGVSTTLGLLTVGFVQLLLGRFDVSVGYLLRVALLSGVYGVVLTPLVAPLVRRVIGARPRATGRRW